MEYFKILQFNREPFSNSPDPRFFYKSIQHVECLQKLEMALRLRRGLNVVLGKVGTGKTTLCRRIMANFDGDNAVEAHFIFDPFFGTPMEFLLAVARLFRCVPAEPNAAEWQLKEQIKHHLFRKGVEEEKTVILIIDEGQKIPPFCLEILREFLNYETNESKLLQIVIFAQTEFETTLAALPNFSDRVNLLLKLEPLSFKDARQMITFRMNRASERGKAGIRFTYPAMREIYRATGGYPRKIVHLCHRIILALILQNKRKVGRSLVRSCAGKEKTGRSVQKYIGWAFAAAFLLALAFWAVIEYGVVSSQTLSSANTGAPPVRIAIEKAPPHVEIDAGQPLFSTKPSETETAALPVAPAGRPSVSEPSPAPYEAASPGLSPEAMPAVVSPSIIGRITVKRQDTVSAMVSRVYGEFTVERMLKVAEANPQIADINQIEMGQVIIFPVLAPQETERGRKGELIQLMKAENLEDAYRFVQASPKIQPPLRVLPCWNAAKGTSYLAVVAQCYRDETSARAAAAKLPPELSARAEVLQAFSPGTLILTPWP